ncbi:hypothetical protein [Micromonospora cathayae]|uniref:Uncharacterized protein n=1 Tax=Micromonospora cathayae TaxID=3028804 RepID=A0ABY7ZZL1_9ACTN|nr:hypothetical protein [Micromonospora sp. HUAS 3]WDZ87189.1 hypothetical protein PVK37_12675 [Micromonospora sp. HUAS 3]
MADLFTPADLEKYLRQGALDAESVEVARRVASGWLRSATQLSDWPDPIPDDLFGWGLELAAIAYNNPEGLASDAVGATSSTWERGRRAEILQAAREAYPTATKGPLFSFPEWDWSWR